jgi:hypothetical protein
MSAAIGPRRAVVMVAAVLLTAFVSAATPGLVREIKVRMSVAGGAPEGGGFLSFRPDFARWELRAEKRMPGDPPRERRSELSEDLLVIAALDGAGREIWRATRPDPRLLRAETADEAGVLHSTKLYRQSVEFWVAVPDDPDLDKVVFFHPEWTGTVFNLVPLGEVRLR